MVEIEKSGKDSSESLQNSKEKENLIDAFNHEIRNAVSLIEISLRAIEADLQTEKQQKACKRIKTKLSRLTTIMERLLNFQSLDKGKFLFKIEVFDLSESLSGIVESTKFLLEDEVSTEKRAIKINTDIPKGIKVAFDETLLTLAVEEVLQNAIKFTPDHSSIDLSLKVGNKDIQVIVEDKGIGLNLDELHSIWEIGFETLESENRSSGIYRFRASGVGIGLTLAKKYLEILGGSCEIESSGRCGAVSICNDEKCLLANKENSMCHEKVRYDCNYLCQGDTKKCLIITENIGKGTCPGSKITLTLPVNPIND